MALIVSCCWVMVVIMMPPVINIWYRLFARVENLCCKWYVVWQIACMSFGYCFGNAVAKDSGSLPI